MVESFFSKHKLAVGHLTGSTSCPPSTITSTLTTSSPPPVSKNVQALILFRGLNMPVFHNLVTLMIGEEFISHWDSMRVLLNNMPNLEHIISLDHETLCPRLDTRMLSSMDQLSAAALPWHDLEIGTLFVDPGSGAPMIVNCNESKVRDYIDSQPKITSTMRLSLIDWLISTHNKFKLTNGTLFLTINIIHRFLAVETVTRRELECLGVAAMLIASKYEENKYSVHLGDYIAAVCEAKYNKYPDVLVMEIRILERLEWKLNVLTPYFFLTWFIKAVDDPSETTMENMVYFYVELGMMNYEIVIRFNPSMMAAASVYAARSTLNKTQVWNTTLEMHTGFSEIQVMECAKMMASFHSVIKDNQNMKEIFNKYSSENRGAVALYPPAKSLLADATTAPSSCSQIVINVVRVLSISLFMYEIHLLLQLSGLWSVFRSGLWMFKVDGFKKK